MRKSARLAAALLLGLAPVLAQAAPAQAVPPKASAGWAVVILGDPGKTSGRQLVLVSPTGQQYPMRGIGGYWNIDDVSVDGRKLLVWPEDGYNPVASVVDVAANTQRAVGPLVGASFTGPTGDRLAEVGDEGLGTSPRKLTLTGKTVFGIPGYPDNVTANPSGTVLLADTAATDTVVSNATGQKIRGLGRPAGGWSECWASHWISDTTFTQVCGNSSGSRTAVYRFSTTGAAPVRLTSSALEGKQITDFWSTSGRQVVRVDGQCEKFAVVRGSALSLYNPKATNVSARAVVNGNLYYGPDRICGFDKGSSLVKVNASTGAVTTLAGGTRNPGKVVYDSIVIGSGEARH